LSSDAPCGTKIWQQTPTSSEYFACTTRGFEWMCCKPPPPQHSPSIVPKKRKQPQPSPPRFKSKKVKRLPF
jgi:hypothetical protein